MMLIEWTPWELEAALVTSKKLRTVLLQRLGHLVHNYSHPELRFSL